MLEKLFFEKRNPETLVYQRFQDLFLAVAEGLEPSARGFGGLYSFLIYSRLSPFRGHIGGHFMFISEKCVVKFTKFAYLFPYTFYILFIQYSSKIKLDFYKMKSKISFVHSTNLLL